MYRIVVVPLLIVATEGGRKGGREERREGGREEARRVTMYTCGKIKH